MLIVPIWQLSAEAMAVMFRHHPSAIKPVPPGE
jgi:hypothetical protein